MFTVLCSFTLRFNWGFRVGVHTHTHLSRLSSFSPWRVPINEDKRRGNLIPLSY